MPNMKNAKKAVKTIEKKRIINNNYKASMKTAVKKARKNISEENLNMANKRIDKACNKGIITKNKAARLKSNLSKKLNETK